MLPPVADAPVVTPATLERTSRLITFRWNTAPLAAVGTPSFARLIVKASIEAQTYCTGPLPCWSSR
jgi:hypothetical protein